MFDVTLYRWLITACVGGDGWASHDPEVFTNSCVQNAHYHTLTIPAVSSMYTVCSMKIFFMHGIPIFAEIWMHLRALHGFWFPQSTEHFVKDSF